MTSTRRGDTGHPCGFPAPAAARAARGRRVVTLLVAVAVGATLAAGCSSSGAGPSASSKVGSWFGGLGSKQESQASREGSKVAYTRRDGVEVRAKADSSSKSLARLGANEKVVRKQASGAWVRVEARGGKVNGWVPASQLVSHAAAAGSAGKPGETASGPAPAEGDAANEGVDANAEDSPAEAAPDTEAGVEPEAANDDANAAPAAPVPAQPSAPPAAAPKPRPVKKGQVAPSVFDPY